MMKKLRILNLITTRWWNASAYYAVTTALGLHRAGHRVIVVGTTHKPPIEQAKMLGLEVYDKLNLESYNPYHFFLCIRQIIKLIQSEQIDIVHAHQSEGHLIAAIAIKYGGHHVPLVRSVSDVRPPVNNYLNEKMHVRYTDAFIFSCQASRERYDLRFHFGEKEMKVIFAGIDVENFVDGRIDTNYRNQFSLPKKHTLIGMICRLSPEKGIFTFMQAAKIVLHRKNNVTFLISGEKSQISHQELTQYAFQLGIEKNVIILDRVDRVQDLISAIDIGVVSSLYSEAVCRIATEFMAFGKPVVATDVNVLPEMIQEGINGFIVNRNKPEEMSEAILKLINNRSLYRKISESNYKNIQSEYHLNYFENQIESVYRKVIKDTHES